MAELSWGDVALLDLENIYDFIAHDSHQYARHQVERIQQATLRLRQLPGSGRHVPASPPSRNSP